MFVIHRQVDGIDYFLKNISMLPPYTVTRRTWTPGIMWAMGTTQREPTEKFMQQFGLDNIANLMEVSDVYFHD